MSERDTDVYLDKIKLGQALILKEMALINQYYSLITMIKRGHLQLDRLGEYDEYRLSWLHILELYGFLKHGYLDKIAKGKKEALEGVIERYTSFEGEEPSLRELRETFDTITLIMDKTGFHHLVRKIDNTTGIGKVEKRFGLGGKKDEQQ